MVKKLQKSEGDETAASRASSAQLAGTVKESAQQIWLAGLGAFAKAQQEGGKVFEALVKQGEQLEQKTRLSASVTAGAAREAALGKAREMQQMAGGTWDKLEQVFEDRVARALSKLGVYTQNDVQRLAERVDELANSVNALLKSGPGQRATGSAGKTSKRAA